MKLELTNVKSWRKTTFEFGDSDCTLISGPSGQGKCFARNTMIRMANGQSKVIQGICPGELVMGWDSTSRTVLSTARGYEEMFRVQGYSPTGKTVMYYTVNASHILTLLYGDNVVDLNIQSYLDYSPNNSTSLKGFRAEIQYPETHVELDPYLYGVVVHGGRDSIPYPVKQAMNHIIRREYGYYYSNSGNLKRVFGRRFRRNLLPIDNYFAAVTGAVVGNESKILKAYLYNSVEIRKQVLAGFVDRNAETVTDQGEIFIPGVTKNLAHTVLELVNSLAGYGYVIGADLFIGVTSSIPTRVFRNYAVFERGIRISVTPAGPAEYYGFELSGDGRFCLEDYTVTHNSSILQGIEFALFGTGKNLVSHGETSCSARLTVGDTVITRTKRPNRLVLQLPNGELEDDAAQAWISQRFSARASITPFITMTPADKLAFLEATAFRDVDIAKLKDIAKNRAKTSELAVAKAQQHLQTTERFLENCEAPGEPPEGYDELEIKDLRKIEKRLKNSRVMVTKIHRSLEHYRKLLESSTETRKEISLLETQKEKLQNELHSIQDVDVAEIRVAIAAAKNMQNLADSYSNYHFDTAAIAEKKSELEEFVTSQNSIIVGLVAKVDSAKESQEPYAEISAELDKLDQYGQLVETLEELEETIESKAAIEAEYASIESRREALLEQDSVSLVCPCCNETVVYLNGNLFVRTVTDTETGDTLESLKKLEKKLSRKLAVIEEAETSHETVSQQISELEAVIIDETTETEYLARLPELEAAISEGELAEKELEFETRKLTEQSAKLQKEITALMARLPETPPEAPKEDSETISERLSALKSDLETAIETVTIRRAKLNELDSINHRLSTIEIPKETEEYTAKLEELSEMLPEHESAVERYSIALEILRDYTEYSRKHTEYSSRLVAVSEAEAAVVEAETVYSSAVALRQKIADAETTTLGSIISTLNAYAADYLEAFFPENPIVVEILPYKETAKRGGMVRKSQISTRVEYRGSETDLNGLSSGERDRVILAYSLAVSQLQNSRVIMLDECTSSLDAETSNVVFSKIRSSLEDKCVLIVAHQIVQGIFDDVLEV